MSPAPTPTPEDVEGTMNVLGWLRELWGYVLGAILGGVILVKAGKKIGEIEELQKDFKTIKEEQKLFALKTDIANKEIACMANIKEVIRQEIKNQHIEVKVEMKEMRDDLSTMNANMFKLLSHMNISAIGTKNQKRRQEDWE